MLSKIFRVAFIAMVLQVFVLSASYAAGPGGAPIPGGGMDDEDAAIMEEMQREAEEKAAEVKEIPPFKMIFVQGGCFEMGDFAGVGDPDERPVHEVCVSDYRLAETEVTQELWEAVMGYNAMGEPDMQKPIARVTWFWATRFLEQLNERTGGFYRLPSEAEWEYAAREGGKEMAWSGTDDDNQLKKYSWFEDNSDGELHRVKEREPNALGFYDMSGNVWEWVDDYFGFDFYKESPKADPYGPDSANWKVIRGGSYVETPHRTRTTYRHAFEPTRSSHGLGFRLAE